MLRTFLYQLFYQIKPWIPRWLQIMLRRGLVDFQLRRYKNVWPMDPHSFCVPDLWPGWPDQKKFGFILTHDVESETGHRTSLELMQIEKDLGYVSCFNFVPERYHVSRSVRDTLTQNGFEVGVHGLNHDGKLYHSKQIFNERALRINKYIAEWKATGFRSPAMHHKLEWLHQLNIQYDMSSFDTDPFEPQPDGVGTIFPFWITDEKTGSRFLEFPYTLPQDFTLFIIMCENSNAIWKKKLDWIAEKGGMALLNTHPDYMALDGKKNVEQYSVNFYVDFLKYVRETYQDSAWFGLPGELASYLKKTFK